MNLKGKNILLITPVLFHYHIVLKEEIEEMGANVLFFPDQPKDALTSLKRKIFTKISHRYYNTIFKKIATENIDFFVLINGKGISRKFILNVRKRNPNAKFITYQWDSLERNNKDRKTNFLYFLDLFNKCYTFDYDDAEKVAQLTYLPNFHTIKSVKQPSIKREIDLLMVATYTEERYSFVRKYANELKKNNIHFKFHLYLPWHHFLLFTFFRRKKILKKNISFSTIKKKKMQELYAKSKAVLDIPYKNQTGYTMRIMEGLANYCHVYTTNKLIINEPFYSANNISVFKLEEFSKIYKSSKNNTFNPQESNVEKLHIKNWIARILKA